MEFNDIICWIHMDIRAQISGSLMGDIQISMLKVSRQIELACDQRTRTMGKERK
jgi:hypothetical protein